MSKAAAIFLAAEIINHPDTILGLATGSTPIGTYEELVRLYQAGILDFSKVRTFNLDEYLGLSPENEQSYRYFMNEHLFSHVNIPMENTHVPSGDEKEAEHSGEIYEQQMKEAGPISIQVLGLGHDGHIGFNEPADAFAKTTAPIALEESTIDANQRFFASREEVPKMAISMGIGTIMRAKKILLLVNGKEKAKILREVLEGPVTPSCPASILQFHPDCTLICDEEAASLLRK